MLSRPHAYPFAPHHISTQGRLVNDLDAMAIDAFAKGQHVQARQLEQLADTEAEAFRWLLVARDA